MAFFRPLLRPGLFTRPPPTLSRSFFSSSRHTLRYHPPQPRGRSLLGFLDNIPHNYVFWGIIGANGAVFCLWQAARGRAQMEKDPSALVWMNQNFTNSVNNLKDGRLWTVISSAFSHQDVGHIFFNMFTFYFMGDHLLRGIGSRQFLFLYLGGGIVSSLTSMAYSHYVRHRDRPAHGASGAVYSVIAAIACFAPRLTFQLYGIVPVPAWLVVSGIFTWDAYNSLKDSGGTTDSVGHVGGLLAGVGYFLSRRYRLF
ncbi:hypothetical protein Agabi119p4_4780 [Agaricus bisporus var. burnettii]|uniref:Peptidase S54 rhomboid domain-containing protein n=1 Tax=Agaricus bisporus var. burnettii TaxID=192524 RepID=A0A8H7KHN8_AGABI|nr:hypothetical protein Agabi119p4_4780 [Agaricus bisporus var. burnettii]